MQTQSEFEKFCDAVYQVAQPTTLICLTVPGDMADNLGAIGLQIVANLAGCPILPEPTSKFHGSKVFRPEMDK